MRVLITGVTGFVGSHMADYLFSTIKDVEIYASIRWRSPRDNIKHIEDKLNLIECDLTDRSSIRRLVRESKPDYVFHFAAQSFPQSSFITPYHTLNTNILGTVNLLEEILDADCDPIIISVSSSEVYGNPTQDEIPITENNAIRAANPYSISKVGHDLMSQYYHKAYGMKIITTRMFSHEGARRGKEFALSSFAYQIAKHEKNKKPPYIIKVGNLDSVRTYAHIADAVHAYWLAAIKGKIGEVYNIGGYHTCTVKDALNHLLVNSSIPKEEFEIVVDPARVRPTDITLQIPSWDKFHKDTGWQPVHQIYHIVWDLLDYWRKNV